MEYDYFRNYILHNGNDDVFYRGYHYSDYNVLYRGHDDSNLFN